MRCAFSTLTALVLAVSPSALAQHTGHPRPDPGQTPPVALSQALKDSHTLLRKVERALNPNDHEVLSEAASRYQAALDAIATASGGSTKDLTRAARTLDSQIEKLERLEASAPDGLVPIMWWTGRGADMMKRIAAPMIGGIFTSFILELAPGSARILRARLCDSSRLCVFVADSAQAYH